MFNWRESRLSRYRRAPLWKWRHLLTWIPLFPRPEDHVVFGNGPIFASGGYTFSAVAIHRDRIVAFNTAAHGLRARGAAYVDLNGRALYPGFIDTHGHWFGDHAANLTNKANPAWNIDSPGEAMNAAVSTGWTTITEHFAAQHRLDDMAAHHRDGDMPLRIEAYLPDNWQENPVEPDGWYFAFRPGQRLNDRVRVAGVKFFADNMFLRDPYEVLPGWITEPNGNFWRPVGELEARIAAVDRAGFQITVHCAGDAATDNMLDIMGRVDPSGRNPRRHQLTHLVVLHDDQIARLRGANLVANIQLSWFHAGETAELYGYFGTSRAAKVGRWKDLVAAGVNVCGSTDFPWGAPVLGPVNRTLYSATTRRGPEGELPEPWMASQVLSIQQAIELLTSKAAWALGIEDERGSIGAGKKADLVVLSQDPVSMRPEDLLELETAMTIVDGHIEHIHPDHELLLSSDALPAWFTS